MTRVLRNGKITAAGTPSPQPEARIRPASRRAQTSRSSVGNGSASRRRRSSRRPLKAAKISVATLRRGTKRKLSPGNSSKPSETQVSQEPRSPCSICASLLPVHAFPQTEELPASCVRCFLGIGGSSGTCRECIRRTLTSRITAKALGSCGCLWCGRAWEPEYIKAFTTTEEFTTYDSLLVRATLTKEPTFFWCQASNCTFGAFYDGKATACPVIECRECQAKACINCKTPWHEGIHCRTKQFEERRTLELMGRRLDVKRCPNCSIPIEKIDGCNSMSCECAIQ